MISIDIRDLVKLRDNVEGFLENENLLEEVGIELAKRLKAKVVARTPVGQYPASSGRKGGTLRKGWEITTEEPMDEDTHIVGNIVDDAEITVNDDYFEIYLVNPVEYAKYVELGHRTSNHQGWVPGRHMLRISINEINESADKIASKALTKALKEVFL